MCTLISLFQVHPSAPLVLALNRDEYLARPTAPVGRWPDDEGGVVAGRDLVSGGTWFGVGARLVAGLTNHRSGVRSLPKERTRGELVVMALRARGLDELTDALGRLPMDAFGPFHLLVTDGARMRCFTNATGELGFVDVEPGVHVLGNFGIDNPEDPVVATVGGALAAEDLAGLSEEALIARLQDVLRRHGEGWPCVHLGPYGTRSGAVLLWGADDPRLLVTEGPSCQAPWREVSELLADRGAPRAR